MILLYTGNVKGAGTDANVYISVIGNQRSTGEICLPSKSNSFEVGSVDKFTFKWKDLGKVTTFNVRLDNQESTQNWYLDFVEILEEPFHVYTYFFCGQWLSSDKELGALSLKLQSIPLGHLNLKKQKYKVIVHTSDVRNAGTDATIYIEIIGTLRRSDKQVLRASREAFARARIDEFFVEGLELGCLTKIIIGHDNTGPFPGWHLQMVEVVICETKELVYFPCGRWLDCAKEDGSISRELVAVSSNPIEELQSYMVIVKTGNCRSASTSANIKINIHGEKIESGFCCLENGSPCLFERGKLDVFILKIPNLGTLYKLEIGHENVGSNSNWFLDKIEVCHETTNMKWFFPCYQWLSSQLGSTMSTKVLEAQSQPLIEDNIITYIIKTITSNIKGAGTSANVKIKLIGVQNSSNFMTLESANTNFQKGTTDEFFFYCKDLGDLAKIIISHDDSGWSPSWHLDCINIKVEEIKKEWQFDCQQWFDSSIGDKAISRELIFGNKKKFSKKIEYKITIVTSQIKGAGTDANVSICLYGQKAFTHPIPLTSTLHDFERGKVDEFRVQTEDLGILEWIEVGHDNTSANPSWHLAEVFVENITLNLVWIFSINQWFDINIGDGLIRRNFWPRKPEELIDMQHYKILIFTSNIKGAGTNANILVQLIGDQGVSEQKKIIPSFDAFEKGSCDEFMIDTMNIGALVKLRIGHDNSCLNPSWHLDRVEVAEEATQLNWVFIHNNWINVNHSQEFSTIVLDPLHLNDVKASQINLCITIYTGDCRGATSNADVSIILYGDVRNSGLQKLKGNGNKDIFERGQCDTFNLNLPFLGNLKELQVQLDGSKSKKGWFLDFIEVDEIDIVNGNKSESNENSKKKWYFPCEQWLATDKGDGLISRLLFGSFNDPRSVRSTYTITTFTSDLKGAGTDANVFIILYGDISSSSRQKLLASYNSFDRGSIDTFTLELHDLGELTEISIGHDQTGFSSNWHLAQVIVKKLGSIENCWKFLCEKWLKASDDSIECTCEMEPIDSSIILCKYTFKIHTTLIYGKTLDHLLSIEIVGNKRSSNTIILEGPQDGNDKSEMHTFCKTIEDVGLIVRACVKVQVTSQKCDAWRLNKIELNKEGCKETWYFPIQRWIGLGSIYNIELLIDAQYTQLKDELIPYEIDICNIEGNPIGYVGEFYIKIIGEQLTVGPDLLEHNLSTLHKEKRASMILHFPPLGELLKVIIGLTKNATLGNHWHLGTVEITNLQLIKKYRFVCRKWIGCEIDSDKIVELEIPICNKPLRHTYQITIYTEELHGGKIKFSIVFYGDKQNSKMHVFEINEAVLSNKKIQKEIFQIKVL